MSTVGILEMLVHLESFRNIDLFYQGLYSVQVYCSIGGESLDAQLVEQAPLLVPSKHPHHLRSPGVLDRESKAGGRVFLVRYSDELVTLNETCMFRAEIPFPGEVELDLYAELFFTDLGGVSDLSSVYKMVSENFEALEFIKVSTAHFHLPNPLLGVNQFIPIVFHDLYSSVIHTSVHCLLTDYKFLDINGSNLDSRAISQVLFPSTGILDTEIIEKVYHSYVMVLSLIHNKIRRLLLRTMRSAGVRNRRERVPEAVKLPVTLIQDRKTSDRNQQVKNPLTSWLKSQEREEVSQVVYEEIREVVARVCEIKFLLLNALKDHSSELILVLEFHFNQAMRNRWGENIFREIKTAKFLILSDVNLPRSHEQVAKTRRESKYFRFLEPLEVEDVQVLPKPQLNPIMFEENYSENCETTIDGWAPDWFSSRNFSEGRRKVHLFVLVHGFMGTAYDMKFVKDTFYLVRPQCLFFLSKANEGHTEGNIEEMGVRLAEEVDSYIESYIPHGNLLKISFVGHSLGGLIIRAALPMLSKYKKRMGTFMSLNSPHLGCVNGNSKLIDAGIWVMSKIKKSLCLKQLALADHSVQRKSYIYRLSRVEGLDWFNYLLLVSSSQDSYVPFESARIEGGQPNLNSESLQIEMANSLLSRIDSTKLARVDVNFGMDGTNKLNTLIGRTAHVQMLDNRPLLTMLVYRYAEAFI